MGSIFAAFGVVGAVGVLAAGMVAIAGLGAIWAAWWLYPGWEWFLVPLGLPQISLWHFIGICTLVFYKGPVWETKPKEVEEVDKSTLVARIVMTIAAPVFAWAWMNWLRG